jgi:hydroxypyruvate reductase
MTHDHQEHDLKLRRDALAIWHAGVEAVRAERLMHEAVRLDGSTLSFVGIDGGSCTVDLAKCRKLLVVGTGKAGAGMAAGLEEILGDAWLARLAVDGWLNVPADCVRPLKRIKLHAARAAGSNEPTIEGQQGAEQILERVAALGPDDLCICLISGGGSALLPAPIEGITLADKLAVTRFLSAAGANIQELNTVRKHLSRIKGGRLARACRAGRLIALVISDVLGDPLDVIGSGPTVPDTSTDDDALAVLLKFDPERATVPEDVWAALERTTSIGGASGTRADASVGGAESNCKVENLVIGNLARAVDAAATAAEQLGYRVASAVARTMEPTAEEVGQHLAEAAIALQRGDDTPYGQGADCLISGGEPVVRLVSMDQRGRGGRNQQLVLAAGQYLIEHGASGIAILSGGTDGEDGPTDAAGALWDDEVRAAAAAQGLEPAKYLARNDAYEFFAPLGALIKTGPTHTNVCDVRVVLVGGRESEVVSE